MGYIGNEFMLRAQYYSPYASKLHKLDKDAKITNKIHRNKASYSSL